MRAKTLMLAVSAAAIAGFVGCGGSTPPSESPEPAAEPVTPESAPAAPAETAEPAPAEPVAENAEEQEEPEKPDVPPEGSPLNRVMQAHFNDALLIRAAVIAGRPEDAADPAHVIASIKNLHDLPEGWQPFVEQMQDTATRIDNSTTPAATAAAAADLGVSCGLCHQKHGGPKPSHDPQPPAGSSVESRMEQHIWATERLWEGLAVPSSEAWNKGAKALSTEPFPEEVLKKGSTDARTAAADFAKLVAKAPSKKTAQDRAALYAELLVTCGTCHLAVEAK